MADQKLTALSEEITPDPADLLYLVVDVGATPASRKATVANLLAVSHQHTTAQVSDFAEAVDDRVASLLVAGSNVTLNYDDAANTLTITAAAGGVTAHSALTGLNADDHAQYALLAGRGGGQTLTGGTAAGENLTLGSTAHATKGSIFLGSAVNVDSTGNINVGHTKGVVSNGQLRLVGGVTDSVWVSAGTVRLGAGINLQINNRGCTVVTSSVTESGYPGLTVNQTWNNAAVDFVGHQLNITNTNSAGNSMLVDWKINGARKFGVTKAGDLQLSGATVGAALGTVVKKLPIYDAAGALLGYVPLYDSIN